MSSVFDLHSDDWMKFKTGVQEHLFTCVWNHSLYIEQNQKYIWNLHLLRDIVVTILSPEIAYLRYL